MLVVIIVTQNIINIYIYKWQLIVVILQKKIKYVKGTMVKFFLYQENLLENNVKNNKVFQ